MGSLRIIYTALRVFGSACFPTLRDYITTKFDLRSLKCVFLGYNEKYKGYRCLHPPTEKIYISRHVVFDETTFPFAGCYSSLHPTTVTPLVSAWHQGFQSSSVPNSDKGTRISIPLLIHVPLPTPANSNSPSTAPTFTEVDLPPLPTSYASPTQDLTTAYTGESPEFTEQTSDGNQITRRYYKA